MYQSRSICASSQHAYRVKLPKSFLAINLSESHTFHRKDTPDGERIPNDELIISKMSGEDKGSGGEDASAALGTDSKLEMIVSKGAAENETEALV